MIREESHLTDTTITRCQRCRWSLVTICREIRCLWRDVEYQGMRAEGGHTGQQRHRDHQSGRQPTSRWPEVSNLRFSSSHNNKAQSLKGFLPLPGWVASANQRSPPSPHNLAAVGFEGSWSHRQPVPFLYSFQNKKTVLTWESSKPLSMKFSWKLLSSGLCWLQ